MGSEVALVRKAFLDRKWHQDSSSPCLGQRQSQHAPIFLLLCQYYILSLIFWLRGSGGLTVRAPTLMLASQSELGGGKKRVVRLRSIRVWLRYCGSTLVVVINSMDTEAHGVPR